MLTGATPTDDGRAPSNSLTGVKGVGNPQRFLAGGQGALPQDSNGRPWNGDYIFSSGDLVEDLTHNFFLVWRYALGRLVHDRQLLAALRDGGR